MSIISLSIPNMIFLVQRARAHGAKALFSRREFPTTSTSVSTQLRPGTRGFHLVNDREITAQNQARLCRSQGDMYSASAYANDGMEREEPIELGRVHVRIDMDRRENYRGSAV